METFEDLKNDEHSPIIIADNDGLIRSVNRCFEETFRWKKADLIGQLLTIIMPEKYRDSHSMGLSRFLMTEIRTLPEHALNLEVCCGDGAVLMSSHTIVAGQEQGAWWLAGKVIPLDGNQDTLR